MSSMEKKKKHRKVTRTLFTRSATELESLLCQPGKENVDIQTVLEVLQEKFEELKAISAEIFDLLLTQDASEDDLFAEQDSCEVYVKRFKSLSIRCGKVLQESEQGSISEANEVNRGKRNFQLPIIQFKKFNGNIRDWLPFWAQFKKVHDDINIDSADKVDYLIQATVPGSRARQLVDSVPATGNHYLQIIDSLKSRFGRDDLQIEVYVRELLKLVLNNAVNKDKVDISCLYDKIETQLRSLEILGITSDKYAAMLFPLIESCLTEELLRIWQRSAGGFCSEIPDKIDGDGDIVPDITLEKRLKALMRFLRNEVENEQRVSMASEGFGLKNIPQSYKTSDNKRKPQKTGDNFGVPTAQDLLNGEVAKCIFCDGLHDSVVCIKAQSFTLDKKIQLVKEKRACFRCLKIGHLANKCRRPVKCLVCSKLHATLMCRDLKINQPRNESKVQSEVQTELNAANYTSNHVFLQTLNVKMIGENESRDVRILIDTGSQRSYILKSTAEKMSLDTKKKERIMHCLFGGALSEQTHNLYTVTLAQDNFLFKLDVLDQPRICCDVSTIFSGPWMKELQALNIKVCDTGSAAQIDLLIGADFAGQLYTGRRHILQCGLVIVETVLGWCLMGKVPVNSAEQNLAISTINLFVNDASIANLWELDVLGITEPTKSSTRQELELAAKQFFTETISTNPDGRFVVRLPWLEGHPPLPSNYKIAQSRLQNALKKLKIQGLTGDYDSVLREWLTEEIIEEVTDRNCSKPVHYLPHRPVIKNESTTKIRPVFDAGCKERNNPSLNQCLEKGLNLIEKIPDILIRFRQNKIGVVADIKKAFLQISVHESDRDCLPFLWVDSAGQEIIYRHKHVVFGVISSPFLLGATIEHHLAQCENKLNILESSSYSAETLTKLAKSFYVDNCVTSIDNEEELTKFVRESVAIFLEAKFDLRGWESTQREGFGSEISVLGLIWNTKKDTLSIKYCLKDLEDIRNSEITKRVILSIAQRIFDPIGFTSPIAVCPKILLQKTWEMQLGWDKPVEESMKREFLSWLDDLKYLQQIEIPRWTRAGNALDKCSLHVFCDASGKAYACVIFLRVEHDSGVSLYLLAAKSRITPKRAITIPRLELLSATIAARLFSAVQRSLDREMTCYFWSDSSVVLSWIRRKEEWMTFVYNRVAEIRTLTSVSSWRHVPGVLNPADLPSRGCSTKHLLESRWWEGPQWLRENEELWPQEVHDTDEEEMNKEKKKKIVSMLNNNSGDLHLLYFSKYTKVIRMFAWIFRFIHNTRAKGDQFKQGGILSVEEINFAETFVFRIIQKEFFTKDDLRLRSLDTFHDEAGVIRLKSRVYNRKDTEDFRLPIVLPQNHPITERLIVENHARLCHCGAQGLLSALREKYWILGGRRYIKSVIGKCVLCRRHKSKPFQVKSPPLPYDRVREAAVFEITGVDFAGPLYLKTGDKVWVCLFTCAIFRAVHFELCTSLSTPCFMKALRRFVARRGRPKTLYSDNGTNFVGTENALGKLDWQKIVENSSVERITWRFNPPTAAWWGGFWERLVGVLKQLLRKMLGRAALSYEDLLTVVLDCEAVVNARPLTYQTNDPEDLVALTPAMFLREMDNSGVPDCDSVDKMSFCKKLRNLQKLREDLRCRFRNEYLGQLRLMSHAKPSRDVTIGEVVLIGNDSDKRLSWPVGRVSELFPGKDGKVRLVRVITARGQLLRPVQRIFPLEIDGAPLDSDQDATAAVRADLEPDTEKDVRKIHCVPAIAENGSDLCKSRANESHTTRSGRLIKVPHRFTD